MELKERADKSLDTLRKLHASIELLPECNFRKQLAQKERAELRVYEGLCDAYEKKRGLPIWCPGSVCEGCSVTCVKAAPATVNVAKQWQMPMGETGSGRQ